MHRRRFLQYSAATAALCAAPRVAIGQSPGAPGFIDTNVYLGRWPFRRLPLDAAGRLAESLRAQGITEAWAGSFDALLHRDLDAVNTELADTCKAHPLFHPIGAINPKLPGWRETLRKCHETFDMHGVRLHPNYHGYTLDDPDFTALLAEARKRKLLVQIAVRMEDTRTQHPKVAVPDVDPAPLLASLADLPGARVQLLNALRTVSNALLLQRLGKFDVHFEIAMLESIEGVRRFLDRTPGTKLAFGSYAPFFYPESATLKLRESILSEDELSALQFKNATALLPT